MAHQCIPRGHTGGEADGERTNFVSPRRLHGAHGRNRLDVHGSLDLTAGHIFGDSPKNPAKAKPAKAALLAVPLSFEANQGQTHSQVKFLSRGDGYSLFLTSNEVVFTLRTPAGVKAPPSVFRMELRGADRGAQVTGADKLAGVANYYVGNDAKKWRSGITTYGRVKYQSIYPGNGYLFTGTIWLPPRQPGPATSPSLLVTPA